MKFLDSTIKQVFIGSDESNHGRFPEILVATFSVFPKDIVNNYPMPKVRNHRKLFCIF